MVNAACPLHNQDRLSHGPKNRAIDLSLRHRYTIMRRRYSSCRAQSTGRKNSIGRGN